MSSVNIEMGIDDLYFIQGALLQVIDRRKEVMARHPGHDAASVAKDGIASYEGILVKVKKAIGDSPPSWMKEEESV